MTFTAQFLVLSGIPTFTFIIITFITHSFFFFFFTDLFFSPIVAFQSVFVHRWSYSRIVFECKLNSNKAHFWDSYLGYQVQIYSSLFEVWPTLRCLSEESKAVKPQNTQCAVVHPCWLLHLYFILKENGFIRLFLSVPALRKILFHPLCVPLWPF